MEIEVNNNSTHAFSQEALASFANLANFAISKMKLHPDCELAISLVDEDEMSSLNIQWMGQSGPTDVLAFPMDEIRQADQSPGLLGDIVLCPAYAEVEAAKRSHSLQSELELLIAHGFLHLLGFDHRELVEEREMFALQEEILREWRT
jgi:probable rRNA maturation factor